MTTISFSVTPTGSSGYDWCVKRGDQVLGQSHAMMRQDAHNAIVNVILRMLREGHEL